MRGALLIAAMCGSIVLAATAHATVGGPEIAHALGWDPVDRKAFFAIEKRGEYGDEPTVVYLQVGASNRGLPVRVSWSQNRVSGDTLYERHLRTLRRRLRPLEPIEDVSVFHRSSVLSMDSIDVGYRMARFKVRVTDNRSNDVFEVATVVEPSVRMIRRYAIPERKEMIGILSYRGLALEEGYEIQWPVLLSPDGGSIYPPRRILHGPWK